MATNKKSVNFRSGSEKDSLDEPSKRRGILSKRKEVRCFLYMGVTHCIVLHFCRYVILKLILGMILCRLRHRSRNQRTLNT